MLTIFPRRPALLALASFPLLLSAQPGLSHATFENGQAAQNSTYKAVIRIPHGCDGQATQTVRVAIPEGVIAVKPMPKAGWTVQTTKTTYAKPYSLYGREVKEGVSEIVWSGGQLGDDQYDEFVFQARMTDRLPPMQMVHIPVVQECATAKVSWTEIPASGQDPHALKFPAPGIRIVAANQQVAQHQHHHGAQAAPTASAVQVIRAGDLEITAPWSRATPGGAKVAGGFMRITNKGAAPDRLIGGSVEIAGIFEVHEMRMDGNVMRMRALEKGLEIKPGETVELKPGGYHVMFIDLRKPLKAGDAVKGTLVFEKAGTVEVSYTVQTMGGGGHDHGQHKH
ncbi:DUF1775 domain-containing protein [Rhabdaerophilum sp. SD176]|uniref:DUF1775 domain-containing protein n=1 Tax=Rhabdaerophilum sp. SD176 TaxID=2983548 RepID=UPI0024DF83E0|nr:DUF1775 domain-containing protein [Rhabdaerophilum sp. SD176]